MVNRYMTKLVKITNVTLYTTTQEGANTTAECDSARTLLASSNIAFVELWYNDAKIDERTPCRASLSTWTLGPAGSNGSRTFTKFPILTWVECYDDWSTSQEAVEGATEIQNASLLTNKALVS